MSLKEGTTPPPLHVMNAHATYERCRSRKLITSFNRQSILISYKVMKELRKDLAKYKALQSSQSHVSLPSHFDKNCFTSAAMDNFDNADKNSLSGRMHAHDTAITLFQVQPDNHIHKPPKDSLDLTNAPNLNKLLCQEIHSFHSSEKLPLGDSFQVQNELYLDQTSKDEFEKYEFIISSPQSIIPESKDSIIPSWARFCQVHLSQECTKDSFLSFQVQVQQSILLFSVL